MLTHVDLFAGSGIGSLAAEAAGFHTVAMCENDPVCQYVLRKLWPNTVLIEDIRKADWSIVPQPVTVLSAGVPCRNDEDVGMKAKSKHEAMDKAADYRKPKWDKSIGIQKCANCGRTSVCFCVASQVLCVACTASDSLRLARRQT